MTFQPARGFMQGINTYVPGMQWSTSLNANSDNTFSLGKPALASATAIATALVTSALGMTWLPTPWVADTPYGRPVVFTPSGSVTATVDLWGEDYLGQPMVERAAWSAVATAVTGKKSFYRVLGMKTVVTGGGVTVNIGTVGSNLGLPFKGIVVAAKEAGTNLDPSGLFAKTVVADTTDPATATTGDPRGQYTATAAFDGIKEFIVGLRLDNAINAANNGGLHGIRQFAA